MIRNSELIREMGDEFAIKHKMTVQQKFDMQDSIYELAYSSGKLTIEDTLGNLKALIKIKKVIMDTEKRLAEKKRSK